MPDLEQEFKDLICKLYELWGGDCDDLDWGDDSEQGVAAANTLKSKYDAEGAPPYSTNEERDANLDLLDSLETKLDDPANPLHANATSTLRDLIADIRNDYGTTGSGGSGSGSSGS